MFGRVGLRGNLHLSANDRIPAGDFEVQSRASLSGKGGSVMPTFRECPGFEPGDEFIVSTYFYRFIALNVCRKEKIEVQGCFPGTVRVGVGEQQRLIGLWIHLDLDRQAMLLLKSLDHGNIP